MLKRSISFLLCMFFIFIVCLAEAGEKIKIFEGIGFALNVNENVKISSRSPVEDFVLYTFSSDGADFLYAYSGNHPDFPKSEQKHSKKEKFSKSKLSGECIEWRQNSKECLIDLDENFPRYVHFWYTEIDLEKKEIADKIIFSIRKIK